MECLALMWPRFGGAFSLNLSGGEGQLRRGPGPDGGDRNKLTLQQLMAETLSAQRRAQLGKNPREHISLRPLRGCRGGVMRCLIFALSAADEFFFIVGEMGEQ